MNWGKLGRNEGWLVIIDAKYKSLFLFPAVGITIGLFCISSFAASLGGQEVIAWLGATAVSIVLPAIIIYLIAGDVYTTSENLPLFLLIAAVGVMVVCWEQFIEGTSGWAPTLVAVASGLLVILYVFWYSRFGRHPSSQLVVGGMLPEFSLKLIDGSTFTSAMLLGAPALIIFYRGNWCPVCMAQIKDIVGRYRDFEKLGMKAVLISPQPYEHSQNLSVRYNSPVIVAVDENNQVAEELGIAIKNGLPISTSGSNVSDTVLPTLLVTNQRGTILFADQTDNYRVRPDPEVILAILRRAGIKSK